MKLLATFVIVAFCCFSARAETVTLTIPDADAVRVLNAYCALYGYADQVLVDGVLVNNPETKKQFFKRKLGDQIKHTVIQHESNTARKAIQKPAIN